MDLLHVGDELEARITGSIRVSVTQGDVVDAVMGEGCQGRESSGFLSSARTSSRREGRSVLPE